MIRKYAFEVRIVSSHGNSFLKIKPHVGTNGQRIRKMDSIYFSELNVPIRERTPHHYIESGWEPEYFLDFENGFNESGNFCNYFNKANQMRILSILEEKVVKSIAEFLEGDLTLLVKGRTINFKADDGLSLYSQKKRY